MSDQTRDSRFFESINRSALAIKGDYKLDPRFYPPKIITFFDQVAAGRTGSSGQ